MNVSKVNELAELPTYASEDSVTFDIKSCFTRGQSFDAYNNWNKQQRLIAKGVGTDAEAFQLPPGIRCLVPTGLKFDMGTDVLYMNINKEAALKKGLCLATGTTVVDATQKDEELFIMLLNLTDSLVTIKNNEVYATCVVQKRYRAKNI